MTIIRAPRVQRDFTILANSVCLDKRLTMRALGVLVRLLCRPDNWRTNSDGLAAEFDCGRDAVRGALHELQKAGYIRMQKTQGANGQWSSAWLVFDEPQTEAAFTDAGKTDAGLADAGKTDAGKPGAITRTDVPRTDETRTDAAKPRKRATSPKRPEGVDPQIWEDWLQLRKAKRAPVTETVVAGAAAEAQKAGMPLGDFLAVWCRRGSQGLEAAWLKPEERSQGRSPPPHRSAGCDRKSRQLEGAAILTGAARPAPVPTTLETIDVAPRVIAA